MKDKKIKVIFGKKEVCAWKKIWWLSIIKENNFLLFSFNYAEVMQGNLKCFDKSNSWKKKHEKFLNSKTMFRD